MDGKKVELGLWRALRATRFIGPSIDEAIETMQWLQGKIDERLDWLLDHSLRKITSDMGLPVYLVAVDEIAYYSATAGNRYPAEEIQRAEPRHRGPRPRPRRHRRRGDPAALARTSSRRRLRDLFGYRWAFRCSTEASSDTILGHGWASKGYTAEDIDPQARGVSWLRAEDGIPRRVKAAYLSDADILDSGCPGRRHAHRGEARQWQ